MDAPVLQAQLSADGREILVLTAASNLDVTAPPGADLYRYDLTSESWRRLPRPRPTPAQSRFLASAMLDWVADTDAPSQSMDCEDGACASLGGRLAPGAQAWSALSFPTLQSPRAAWPLSLVRLEAIGTGGLIVARDERAHPTLAETGAASLHYQRGDGPWEDFAWVLTPEAQLSQPALAPDGAHLVAAELSADALIFVHGALGDGDPSRYALPMDTSDASADDTELRLSARGRYASVLTRGRPLGGADTDAERDLYLVDLSAERWWRASRPPRLGNVSAFAQSWGAEYIVTSAEAATGDGGDVVGVYHRDTGTWTRLHTAGSCADLDARVLGVSAHGERVLLNSARGLELVNNPLYRGPTALPPSEGCGLGFVETQEILAPGGGAIGGSLRETFLTTDGSEVILDTNAPNLGSTAARGYHTYVYDRVAGTYERMPRPGDGGAELLTISPNGRYLAYDGVADAAVSCAPNEDCQVLAAIYDRETDRWFNVRRDTSPQRSFRAVSDHGHLAVNFAEQDSDTLRALESTQVTAAGLSDDVLFSIFDNDSDVSAHSQVFAPGSTWFAMNLYEFEDSQLNLRSLTPDRERFRSLPELRLVTRPHRDALLRPIAIDRSGGRLALRTEGTRHRAIDGNGRSDVWAIDRRRGQVYPLSVGTNNVLGRNLVGPHISADGAIVAYSVVTAAPQATRSYLYDWERGARQTLVSGPGCEAVAGELRGLSDNARQLLLRDGRRLVLAERPPSSNDAPALAPRHCVEGAVSVSDLRAPGGEVIDGAVLAAKLDPEGQTLFFCSVAEGIAPGTREGLDCYLHELAGGGFRALPRPDSWAYPPRDMPAVSANLRYIAWPWVSGRRVAACQQSHSCWGLTQIYDRVDARWQAYTTESLNTTHVLAVSDQGRLASFETPGSFDASTATRLRVFAPGLATTLSFAYDAPDDWGLWRQGAFAPGGSALVVMPLSAGGARFMHFDLSRPTSRPAANYDPRLRDTAGAPRGAFDPHISRDGNRILFVSYGSSDPQLDDDDQVDVWLEDRARGYRRPLSADIPDAPLLHDGRYATLSGNGRYAAFSRLRRTSESAAHPEAVLVDLDVDRRIPIVDADDCTPLQGFVLSLSEDGEVMLLAPPEGGLKILRRE